MMRVFAAYIMRAVLGYTALVLMVLLMLVGLYLFVDQQSDVGTGRYGMLDALLFVICNLPDQGFQLLPMAALLGALLALGNLARGSELIAMRAAGASVWRIAYWVAGAGAILMVFSWVVGDYVAPPLEQFAYQQRMLAKFNQFNVSGSESLWAKDGNTFIAVQSQHSADSYGGIYVLRFDDQHHLLSVGHADAAKLLDTQRWQLSNYVETRFADDSASVTQLSNAELSTTLSPEFIGAASKDPYQLTGAELRSFINHLRNNQLEAREYELAFWSRVALTFSILIIVILAVPFSFGPMRSRGFGARMVIGILLGATYFLVAKLLNNAGTVFHWQPLLVAWLPTTLLVLVTGAAITRVR